MSQSDHERALAAAEQACKAWDVPMPLAVLEKVIEAYMREREPYGYAFQHEDTGLQQVVDVQQVEWGFEKNNPRWINVGPVYSHASDMAAEQERADYKADYFRRHKDAVDHLELAIIAEARAEAAENRCEELVETNRKLHRRLQIAEAVCQSADDYLKMWISVFSAPFYKNNDRRFKERHFLKFILQDLRHRVSKLADRALSTSKGETDG